MRAAPTENTAMAVKNPMNIMTGMRLSAVKIARNVWTSANSDTWKQLTKITGEFSANALTLSATGCSAAWNLLVSSDLRISPDANEIDLTHLSDWLRTRRAISSSAAPVKARGLKRASGSVAVSPPCACECAGTTASPSALCRWP